MRAPKTTLKQFLVALSTSLLLATAANANVECEKQGRFWYPKNEVSKKIATALGVKTCNGKRFKEVVAKLGMKSNVVAGKKSLSVEEVAKLLSK